MECLGAAGKVLKSHLCRNIELGGTGGDHLQEKLTLLLRVVVLLFMNFLVQPGRLKRPAHRLRHLAYAGLFRRLARLAPSSGPTWATRVPSAPSTASGPKQSRDFNAIEAVWHLLKQRLRMQEPTEFGAVLFPHGGPGTGRTCRTCRMRGTCRTCATWPLEGLGGPGGP